MIDEVPPLTTREKSRKPKGDKGYWCGGCDANTPRVGEKCWVCGHTDKGVEKQAHPRDRRVYFDT